MLNFLEQFKTIPNTGIIAFISEIDKTVFVFFSNSSFTLFCTHIYKLKLGIHDNKLLQDRFNQNLLTIQVIKGYDSIPESVDLRCEYERTISKFKADGYTDMREGYKAISYRIKIYVLNDFRAVNFAVTPLVYVCGRSTNVEEIVLGIFDSIPLAEEWLNSVYGDKRSGVLPEFVDNELTREYHRINGYEIYRAS